MLMVQETFQKVLSDLGVKVHHDVMGCKDCQWEGQEVIYYIRSHHNQDHPFHECPRLGQECC